MIESAGLDLWLSGIREQLRAKTYKSQPVCRAMITKPGGGQRPLCIPTIRDRVIQTAAKVVIEPIVEVDLESSLFGYGPKRCALDAIVMVHELLKEGYTDVIDADLTKYSDKILHNEMIQCVARRIEDRHVLRLIKLWLKSPIEEQDRDGKKRIKDGRKNKRDTPQ